MSNTEDKIKSKAAIPNPRLEPLQTIIGVWKTTGSHPAVPGKNLHGKTSFEWLEGGAFVILHSHLDDSRFPEGIAIIGSDDETSELFMLYFDERKVSRRYSFSINENGWGWSRNAKDLSQRFQVTFVNNGQTMVGLGEMSKNGGPWEKDLDVTYERST